MSARFTIASVTKQFTAFAVMLLYDRGLLSLGADANTYLPEDMQIPSGITVHDLLSHRKQQEPEYLPGIYGE